MVIVSVMGCIRLWEGFRYVSVIGYWYLVMWCDGGCLLFGVMAREIYRFFAV